MRRRDFFFLTSSIFPASRHNFIVQTGLGSQTEVEKRVRNCASEDEFPKISKLDPPTKLSKVEEKREI